MLKLNVCPFCGGEAELSKDEYGRYSVFCTSDQCGAVMVGFKNKQQVIDSWNTRIDKLHIRYDAPSIKPQEQSITNEMCTVGEMVKRLKGEGIQLGESALRRLLHTGEIPGVRIGVKWLVSYSHVMEFLEKGNYQPPKPPEKEYGKIRRID